MGNVKEIKDNVIDLDFGAIARTKIRINGDNTKVIELNLSDMGIISRLSDTYPKLNELQAEVGSLASAEINEDDENSILKLSEDFKVIDNKMKDLVNKIFDFDVCTVLCDGGSMYDPINGMYRFEYIIDKLSNLYENNMNEEFKRIRTRMDKHTAKYTKKRK